MRVIVRLSTAQSEQLNTLKGKTTSDKLRYAIKLAHEKQNMDAKEDQGKK